MANHDVLQKNKPYLAIAVGDAWQRSQIADSLMSFYRFAQYADISAALAGCRERRPLGMLVSEALPRSGGFDLVHMLRLDLTLATIPVVMLVSKDDRATRERVAECGTDGLLAAPLAGSALVT